MTDEEFANIEEHLKKCAVCRERSQLIDDMLDVDAIRKMPAEEMRKIVAMIAVDPHADALDGKLVAGFTVELRRRADAKRKAMSGTALEKLRALLSEDNASGHGHGLNPEDICKSCAATLTIAGRLLDTLHTLSSDRIVLALKDYAETPERKSKLDDIMHDAFTEELERRAQPNLN